MSNRKPLIETSDSQELFDDNEVAPMMRVLPQTLPVWRSQGKGPAYLKLGRRVFYRRADILAWMEAQVIQPKGK